MTRYSLSAAQPPASLGPVYGIHGKYAVWARLGILEYTMVKILLGLIERLE
jgi:hypothetical protein